MIGVGTIRAMPAYMPKLHFKKPKSRLAATIVSMVLIVLVCACIWPKEVFGATSGLEETNQQLNSSVIEELNQIDFSAFNNVIEDFEATDTNIFSITNIKNKVYSVISGENAVNYSSLLTSMLGIIGGSILKYLPMLSVIVAIGVIGNMLNGFKSKFNEKSSSNLIQLVCFMAVSILIIAMIKNLVASSTHAVESMAGQMNAIFPILLTLMIGLGATSTASVFQPVVAIMSTYIADFFTYFIVPLFMVSFVFSIISNLNSNVKLNKFNAFISSFFKWSVGLIFTIFFAVFALQGITAGKFDSLSIRTTKYTIKSYLPVMGGYLADGMDLILASTVLIKNAVGFVGILLVITTIISPLIQIAIFSLLLKLVGAILQTIGEGKTSDFLTGVSKSITMLSSAIIAVGFMYLLSVGLVVTSANVVV